MKIELPAPVTEIIEKLYENGYEAYAVGGCVRDMLLGRTPGDWDITTSALPQQVKQVFRRTIDTGIQHGTVTVMIGKAGYEVTTYRVDGEYTDGRHPDNVAFTRDLTEDLKRRDFTINAMAYNERTGFVDEFGGAEDLKKGVIRCVGQPMDRFTEDALRILRAIRFSAQLNFEIEEETRRAIEAIAPNIRHVSKERIQVELTKLLLSDRPGQIRQVYETGISAFVSPAFHRACGSADGAPAAASGTASAAVPTIPVEIPAVKALRWAAFLRCGSADEAALILRDLKLDNDTIYKVRTLVEWLRRPLDFWAEGWDGAASVRKAMSLMEPELFDALLDMKGCLLQAETEKLVPETPERLAAVRTLTEEIRLAGHCITMKNLAVTGNDVIGAGIKPGRAVGKVLGALFEQVLKNPGANQREYLLSQVERMNSSECS